MEEAVVAVVSPSLAVTEVRGGDRLAWLNGLVTADVREAKDGRAVYGLAVSKVGRIQADVFVVDAGDSLLVASPARVTEGLREAFDKYLVMEDAELVPQPNSRCIRLHGAEAAKLARSVATEAGGRAGAVDDGAILIVAAEHEARARELLARGARVVDESDYEATRIAAGEPRFGFDFDEKTYPQEASLEKRAVSFSKGCYLGQEVVCRLEMRGHVHRKLVGLDLAGGSPIPGSEVRANGEVVGHVTSAADRAAIAMVKFAHAEPGTTLEVDGASATVRSIGG